MADYRRLLACGMMLLLAGLPLAQAQSPGATDDSCRKFVQNFYGWYLPRAKKYRSGPASDLVLKYRSRTLSHELFSQLKADSEAQAKSDEIVGLDFDPFLSAQDDGFERCTAGKVTVKALRYLVEVTCVYPGANADRAKIIPELEFRGTQWLFLNFHYQIDAKEFDLLTLLKQLREERQTPAK